MPVEYSNSIGMKFVLIPPGEFLMGSTPEEVEATLKVVDPTDVDYREKVKTEVPRHKVILSKAIYLGAHEVTQKQYQEIMGTNPSAFGGVNVANAPAAELASLPEGTETSEFPVDSVSWNDAAEFCAKLSQKEKFKPSYFRADNNVTMLEGNGYRLPTEAEWEFACRAGTTTRYWSGDKDADLLPVGWFGSNSGRWTHEAGELKANPFGLRRAWQPVGVGAGLVGAGLLRLVHGEPSNRSRRCANVRRFAAGDSGRPLAQQLCPLPRVEPLRRSSPGL